MLRRFIVADIVSRIARMECVLIGMTEKTIRRDTDEPFAREPFGQILRMRHEAIAFVHHHYGWRGT